MLDLLAVAAEHAEHAEPTAFGLQPGGFVALSMLCVIAIMLYAGVPKLIAKGLDAKISGIRQQLDEAAKLRAEAEALVARHQAMAEDKIAAAQRAVVDELRGKAAEAAAIAARQLIAAKHDEASDRKLVDQAISGL